MAPKSIKSTLHLEGILDPWAPGRAQNPSKIDAKTKVLKGRSKGPKPEDADTYKLRICDACAVQMTSHGKHNFSGKLKKSSKLSPFWVPFGLPFWSLFHKSGPRGPGTHPKVPKRHLNGPQGCPNRAQGCPNGAPSFPKTAIKTPKSTPSVQ